MAGRRVFIFANGKELDDSAVRAAVQPGDDIVAADGGLRHVLRLGLRPGLLIGDLDSVDPDDAARLEASGTRVERHPVHKDETDLELALLAAVRAGYTDLWIAGALGGRLDMTLGNIFLLALPELRAVDARLWDGQVAVFLIFPGPGAQIDGPVGQRVSLLPMGAPARGIRTEGLEYPLHGETLYPERSRGISNRLVESPARITLEAGCLICMVGGEDENR